MLDRLDVVFDRDPVASVAGLFLAAPPGSDFE